MGSDTKETYAQVNDISAKKDEPALLALIIASKVFVIPYGTRGTIREVAFGKYLIDVELTNETKRLWVAQEFIE